MKSAPKDVAAPAPFLRRSDSMGVATLTLNDPGSRNALSLAMIEALNDALADIAHQPDVRAIVFAGQGPAFSSGHDLREIAAHRNDRDGGKEFYERLMRSCGQMMQAIVNLPKPVIAAVEGVATAAGCQLVASCDLAIAGQGARFATPGVNIGLFCSTPMVAIARTISRKHAMEMAWTGALYSADDAERFGLINRVVPAGQALARAQEMAAGLAQRSAKTLAIGKKTFYEQVELSLSEAYAVAGRAMVENLLLPDAAEGIDAFLEKRPPQWERE
ncbi:enoyl-CoA hydratase [Methylocapsa sp. S129]|uniref:enoyl-CoA hydratase n=1 Tax=Methylocapsa sp. S129 TaxID=1641869 RepID=UPI00131E3C92|nr:enoyl-CoA hydratase [Methylocapsa sp. S129]